MQPLGKLSKAEIKKQRAITFFATGGKTARDLQEELECSENKAHTLVNLLIDEKIIKVHSWRKVRGGLARIFMVTPESEWEIQHKEPITRSRKPRIDVVSEQFTRPIHDKVPCYGGLFGLY